jgi:ABC-type lipoprotein release transport system permease subunit
VVGHPAGDPLTFASVIGLMAIVAMAASVIPAIRAARVDPMEVLRDQ